MAFVAPNREAGRLLYQGMMDQARGIAGAVNQFVDEGYKRQEQDKEFNAKLKVAEQTLKTFIKPKAAEFGTTPEAIDAMLQSNSNPDLSPKERYLQIGGFLEQAITSSKMNRDMQQADTQRKYTDALAAGAMAQKSATDAATAERQRETALAGQFVKSIKELEDLEQLEQSGGDFTIEQTDRYQQLKGNEMLKRARQAGELGMDAASFIKMTQGDRSLQLQQQDITNRKTVADLKAENDRLQELIKAGQKQPPVPAGEIIIEGRRIPTVWGGPSVGYVDPKSGLPVSTRITKTDPDTGEQTTSFGGRNPAIYDYYKGQVGGPVAGTEQPEADTEQPEGETEQPDPTKLTRVSGTGTPSRGPINTDFLYRNSPRFNTAEEVQAAVNDNPSLIGKIVLVGGKPVRVKGPE